MNQRIWLGLVGVVIVVGAVAAWRFKGEPMRVPVYRVARGSFEDQVSTNGRVEPSEWESARAEREGLIVTVPVARGQAVVKGAALAVLDSKDAQADLASAEARIEEAKAAIQDLVGGGRRRDIVEIEEGLKQRRSERAETEKDLAIAERLAARNAGTREEVRLLKSKLDGIVLQISGLEARKPALVAEADVASARARLQEAQSAAELARRRIELSTVRSPAAGVVYQLDAKAGSYVSPGALIANVGQVSKLKVIVYVDEPELGRVQRGMPITISWDAIEGKRWSGAIDRVPTQIVALGTRQVGEVECRIENRDGDLLPGTNVNVQIQTKKQDHVLLVAKEAVRNRDGKSGVYAIENGALVWREVRLGSGSVSNVIALEGLKEGDVLALGPEGGLKAGARVEAQQ